MMPRLLPAEASKPRWYQPLLVTAGIILTCYGLLTAVSTLLPILRERIEANRAGSVNAFRDRIIVYSKPTAITITPRPILVLPTAPVPTVETVPQSYDERGFFRTHRGRPGVSACHFGFLVAWPRLSCSHPVLVVGPARTRTRRGRTVRSCSHRGRLVPQRGRVHRSCRRPLAGGSALPDAAERLAPRPTRERRGRVG
jgi:hypothetical protein